MARILVSVALSLFVLFGISACSRAADSAPARAVIAYLDALPAALNAESLDALRQTATPAEVERVRLFVVQSVGLGERMRAQLAEFEIEEVITAPDGAGATVVTREEWDIAYVDVETGEQLRTERHASSVTYQLVLVEGRWLVDSLHEERPSG